jgi:hypothetical protein
VHVDYAKREAIVGLNIDLSTPEATGGSEEESYRAYVSRRPSVRSRSAF